ncbi:MAG: chalcone isomerase family protein [Bdellovibrionales bacterium]|nr:chalcone isomerase family protein [Bdellovibrionales bacterium]
MKNSILLFLSLILMSCGSTQKKQAIEEPLPVTVKVGQQELVKQGEGFRIGSKMGFTAKVYKIGFYTDKKYSNASDILDSNKTKHLYMRFTYTVTKGQLTDGWKKAYEHSCIKKCDETKQYLNQFLEASSGMKIGEVMEITFTDKGLELNIHKIGKVFIASPEFSYNLMAVFIGPKVLDEKFKKDLMD